LCISDVQVKDPNNPANLIDGKLIVFRIANWNHLNTTTNGFSEFRW
jgi:hypothetical protein